MDEKIIIKSKMDQKAKNVFVALIVALFSISAILFLALATEWQNGIGSTSIGYSLALYSSHGGALACFIIACLAFLFGALISIIYLMCRKCEIIITEKNVRGKAILGKEVVLPIYMVSA